MRPYLLVLFSLSLFSVSLRAADCICPMIYFPICAVSGTEFADFSNECMARCGGYHFAYTGKCLSENTQAAGCIESCNVSDDYVCGQKGDAQRTVPNACVAKCQGFSIVKQGTCNNERVLGLSDFFRKAKTAIKEAYNTAKDKIVDTAKDVGNKIKDKANEAGEAIKNAAHTVANKTKEAAEKIKEAAHNVADKTKEIAEKVKNKTKEAAGKIKEKAKRFANRTKEFFKDLANRIVNRVRKIKEGIENCTCHIVDKTQAAAQQLIKDIENKAKETAERIKNGTQRAWNATKTAVKNAWDQTRDGVIKVGQFFIGITVLTIEKIRSGAAIMWGEIQDAFRRTKRWFKNLLGCGCTRDYQPVCIRADNGKEATMLNKCYADCGDLEVLHTGECKEVKESEAIVIE